LGLNFFMGVAWAAVPNVSMMAGARRMERMEVSL